MIRNARRTIVLAIVVLAIACAACIIAACEHQTANDHKNDPRPVLEANDGYRLTDQDLQLPELPTGCEATSLSTLLRLNGIDTNKTDVANAMPKSNTDFVNAFWGDPYSTTGGCAMAPCVAETADGYLIGSGLAAYETEGQDLADLPMPSIVWVTIDLAEPQGPIKTQGTYEMYYPSHTVVVLGITGDTVQTIDPLRGYMEYPLDKFNHAYKTLGGQSVHIAKE